MRLMAVENRVYAGCLARPLPVWGVRRVDEVPDGAGHDVCDELSMKGEEVVQYSFDVKADDSQHH